MAEAVVNPDITEWLMKRISQPSLYKEKYMNRLHNLNENQAYADDISLKSGR